MQKNSTISLTAPKKLRYLLGGVALIAGSLLAQPAKAQTWMVSTTPHIKLGILDKYNSLGGYTANFIVTDEKTQQEYILIKQVPKGESGVDVMFPTEPSDPEYFKNAQGIAAQPVPGRYVWECRVNGKKAVGGHFNFPEAGNDITIIETR